MKNNIDPNKYISLGTLACQNELVKRIKEASRNFSESEEITETRLLIPNQSGTDISVIAQIASHGRSMRVKVMLYAHKIWCGGYLLPDQTLLLQYAFPEDKSFYEYRTAEDVEQTKQYLLQNKQTIMNTVESMLKDIYRKIVVDSFECSFKHVWQI